jgi:two-component system C4-dicarboxylate transport sensor histidine kinase DctB
MITVSANINAQANSADISIKDNGGGVDVADLGKVFDPFFTTKMSGKNVGLGLASSRALIEEIGGDVTLRSSDNETIVKISLPLILPPSSTGVVL